VELRWVLLALGITVVGLVYWLSMRQRFNPTDPDALRQRTEPALAETEDVAADDNSSIPAPSQPRTSERIIALRLVAHGDGTLDSEAVVLALRDKGLRHGRYGIFHRYRGDEDADECFSVASLLEPGSFDLAGLKDSRLPGVSLFMVLPNVGHEVEVFDDMVRTGRELSQELDADLLDERGSSWSYQRERYVREEIIQFLHQRGS
jgi:cell division protein ZipA